MLYIHTCVYCMYIQLCYFYLVKCLKTVDELSKMVPAYERRLFEDVKVIIENTEILLITANEIERNGVLYFLEPRVTNGKVVSCEFECKIGLISKPVTYLFGRFAGFNAAVYLMINQGPLAAHNAVVTAANCFSNLKEIYAVGVLCGARKSKKLDVIVANKATFYTEARFGTVDKKLTVMPAHTKQLEHTAASDHPKQPQLQIKPRAPAHIPTSEKLVSYFKEEPLWPTDESKIVKELIARPKRLIGEILSGNYLIDNSDTKDLLINTFSPEAIGIEMECAGLLYDQQYHKMEIIMVKAVCDYGDGDKDKKYQPTAALLAADCVHHYLGIRKKGKNLVHL